MSDFDGSAILFYSGDVNRQHRNGTGFIVNKKVTGNISKFEAISDRISILRVKTKFFNITMVNAYAPTEVSDEEGKDCFYEELEVVVDQIPEYDAKIVVGDFNAKVGWEELFLLTTGLHRKHKVINENCLRMISFAAAKSMVVRSTMFSHKNIHKGTWKSPDGVTVNQS